MIKFAASFARTVDYALFLEDDIHLCPGFFATLGHVLRRPPSSNIVKQDLPIFVGGFGASAMGYPTKVLPELARFLNIRIRDSNVDVLISKGLDPNSHWFKPLESTQDVSAHRDQFVANNSCIYKPSRYLVLHLGAKSSNFGVKHTENPRLVCGASDMPAFFVTKFPEEIKELSLFRSCPLNMQ